ncbi:ABC transporter ATP-binding protein [Paenibacillus apis]|uniref:Teichoic acid ABC transporter ATP-binding protein n=1 Tax=Paenibacillus apis TaxID=1792174 RepID=A0A920CIS7_9BACL|nr:ABC transporter ATP-binding protein [Paenibacillus apis]GIO41966.1 teichoic acid ABC transporter ATP-binding protein [Paenibacillus apis]
MEYIIEVENLSLNYRFIKSLSFKEWASNSFSLGKKESKIKTFKALQDVSFNIEKGKTVGIIGENGAGKSTLLKVLANVYAPDEGIVKINTDSISLLTLATGFKSDLSGLENIYINGLLLGLSKKELDEKFEEITVFSELGGFLANPVRTYSSGMKSKLAFSIASHVNPDLLFVDEVFSVGDARFRKKSGAKIKELINSDRTVVMVSHSEEQIKELCNEVIWLDKGKLIAQGETTEILKEYNRFSNR